MSTALGSLFRFTGLVCCRFTEECPETHEADCGLLTAMLPLFPHWQTLPAVAELPEALQELETVVCALVKEAEESHMASLPKPLYAAVRAEYQRLFLAPDQPVSLWESVWRSKEKLLFTEETSAVRSWYARQGLEIVHVGHEAEDHLGLELFFVGWLLDKQRTDEAEAFLTEHASEWIPACCEALETHATTAFWKAVCRVGKILTLPVLAAPGTTR